MFGFLKDKLKSIVAKFTKKVETEAKEEVVEVEKVHSSVHSFLDKVESHGAASTIINHENF